MIQFDDQFEVAAAAATVMSRFTDVERIAECVPGVTMQGRDSEGNYLGTMTVSFGPKRIKFQGKVRCEFDMAQNTGILVGGGIAGGRAATVQVRTEFSVRDLPGSGPANARSVVEISATADLKGVLAPFAASGGALMAKPLMQDFAAALAAQLANDGGAGAQASIAGNPPPVSEPLSVAGLLLRSFGEWFKRWRSVLFRKFS